MPKTRVSELIKVGGVVQGVGFRPFVYAQARSFDVCGTILNNAQGVLIEAEGAPDALADFVAAIVSDPPPQARVDSLERLCRPAAKGFVDFTILPSLSGSQVMTLIPPDIAMCAACHQDIITPGNRRAGYPFTNCSHCGPRYSIVEGLPYDRAATSMKDFDLCPRCRAEYEDPGNRRFHAQPNACALCGPRLSLRDAKGNLLEVSRPLASVATALKDGLVVAIRGLGGFQLLVDAGSATAVARLRTRKCRRAKPLAVMVASLERAQGLCHIGAGAASLLEGAARPIVLLPCKEAPRGLVEGMNPGLDELGIMLPYTPLHLLLLREEDCPEVLVVTSGNRSGSAMIGDNSAAISELSGIADLFLCHDRDILSRVDDSVVRRVAGRNQVLRRARGYVPNGMPLLEKLPVVLACGAALKATFCLIRGREAFLSQHLGDLSHLDSLCLYRETITHLRGLLQVTPEVVVCDIHPDYLSSHYAKEVGLPLIRVQHHHAHAMAVSVEHGLSGQVLALILDGSGLGDDGTLWGGEVLAADAHGYTRLGSFSAMSLPGGDVAAREPWRMALSLLQQVDMPGFVLPGISEAWQEDLQKMMGKAFNCPPTSSCGRFFDGISALLGICLVADYEGQAALELEVLARKEMGARDMEELLRGRPFQGELLVLDNRLVLQQQDLTLQVLQQLAARRTTGAIALDFHLCLIHCLSAFLVRLAGESGLSRVVLGGGCLQNTLLLKGLFVLLKQQGLAVYTGEQIPVNDGGIALGQAIIGGVAYVSGSPYESD